MKNITKKQEEQILQKLEDKGLLEIYQNRQTHTGKDRAKVVRIFLQVVFPDQKFSVLSRKGSKWITISWIDGISRDAVMKVMHNLNMEQPGFTPLYHPFIKYNRKCSEKAYNFIQGRFSDEIEGYQGRFQRIFNRITFEGVTV